MKGWKLCGENKSQAWHQKMIGDHYRYAYDALNMQQFPDKDEDEDKLDITQQAPADLAMIDPYFSDKEMKAFEKEKKLILDKAHKAYAFGLQKAEKGVISSNPQRLGLALNYAVFTYDVLNDKEEAKRLASRAIEVANKKLDQLKDPDERQDAETVIELIEENIK